MSDNSYPDPSSGENRSREKTGKKSDEMIQQVLEWTKQALGHAIDAIKAMVTDPMNGQSKALGILGETNAFSAGMVFITVYIIAALIGSRVLFGPLTYWGSGFGFGWYIKLFISSLIPIIALFAVYLLIGKALGKKDTNWMVYVFTTGVTILPMVILFLLFWFPYQAVTAIGVFCLSLTVLLVYSALSGVYSLSSKTAFWLTPVLFLVVAFLSRVFYYMII